MPMVLKNKFPKEKVDVSLGKNKETLKIARDLE
jgi:hypothetical protein